MIFVLFFALLERTVEMFFEDGLGNIHVKFGLELREMMRGGATVGAATSIGEAEIFVVIDLFGKATPRLIVSKLINDSRGNQPWELLPVALAAPVLLDLLRVNIGVAMLGEEARKMLSGCSGALSKPLVVTIIGLVRTSHYAEVGRTSAGIIQKSGIARNDSTT